MWNEKEEQVPLGGADLIGDCQELLPELPLLTWMRSDGNQLQGASVWSGFLVRPPCVSWAAGPGCVMPGQTRKGRVTLGLHRGQPRALLVPFPGAQLWVFRIDQAF